MARILYKLFLAIMVALFIGFGIAVFYAAPKAPEYPVELMNVKGEELSASQKTIEITYENQMKEFQSNFKNYNRNVSSIIIAFSVVLLVISLVGLIKLDILGDGLLFAGILTLGYGIIRAFMSDNPKFQFIVVTIGLIITLSLGYIKFIKASKTTPHAS